MDHFWLVVGFHPLEDAAKLGKEIDHRDCVWHGENKLGVISIIGSGIDRNSRLIIIVITRGIKKYHLK